jgi:cytochrome c556
MRKRVLAGVVVVVGLVGGATIVGAHEKGHAASLPAGPIRERHQLMEGIGDDAKAIGNALKKGDTKSIAAPAAKIQVAAAKVVPLFPEGSTNPKSRAKPEIWQNWSKFTDDAQKLERTAGALAAAAQGGGDVKAAAETMFGACKSCHDDFRKPEKGK